MLGARGYKTKKALRACIGEHLRYEETSVFGPEYRETGVVTLVGPDAHTDRRWFARVELKDGKIVKVS